MGVYVGVADGYQGIADALRDAALAEGWTIVTGYDHKGCSRMSAETADSGHGASYAFGSNLTSTAYYRTYGSTQELGWIEWDYADAIELTEVRLMSTGVESERDRMIRDFTCDYWDGSVWQTAMSTTGQTGWAVHEIRAYPFPVAVGAHTRWRLSWTANNGDTLYSEIQRILTFDAGGFRTLQDHSFAYMLRGPSDARGQAPVVYVYCNTNVASNYYVMRLYGAVGTADYVQDIGSGETITSTGLVSAVDARVPLEATGVDIPYWIAADQYVLRMVCRTNGGYMPAYVGLFSPYGSPTQYPYPMLVGGVTNKTATTSAITGGEDQAYWKPGDGTCYIYMPDGAWRKFSNTGVSGDIDSNDRAMWPYRMQSSTPVSARHQPYIDNLAEDVSDGAEDTYSLYPIIPICSVPHSEVLGELEGVAYVSGHLQSAENQITVGLDTWIVFPNLFRTGIDQFFAMKLA